VGKPEGIFKLETARSGLSLKNRFWHYLGLSMAFAGFVFFLGESAEVGKGLLVIGSWLLISLVAILMLKTVDYIEHKGLSRAAVAEGRFEPVRAQHSWDSHYLITNFALFNLGFHSNHHLKAAAPFTDLGRTEGSARMPYGYAVMVLRSLVGK